MLFLNSDPKISRWVGGLVGRLFYLTDFIDRLIEGFTFVRDEFVRGASEKLK